MKSSKDSNLTNQLISFPIFQGLSVSQLNDLAEAGMRCSFKPGERLINRKDPPNRFYLIFKGQVEVLSPENGPENGIKDKRNLVGAWSLVSEQHSQFEAVATQPVEAVFFYTTWIRRKCEENDGFGLAVSCLAERALTGSLTSNSMR